MKRLTGKYENGTSYYNIVPGESTIDRLAAYEETGLEPEEIIELKARMEGLEK